MIRSPSPTARGNIVTLAWVGTVCSAPPMLSIAVRPSRYSYELLRRSYDFVVNVPRADRWSGRLLRHRLGTDVDKFALSGFHASGRDAWPRR